MLRLISYGSSSHHPKFTFSQNTLFTGKILLVEKFGFIKCQQNVSF